jgi:thiosulfate/3-mercaptopyruvate sulfurtransferase
MENTIFKENSNMRKPLFLALALTFLMVGTAFAYNTISTDQVKVLIEQQEPVILVDIQPEKDFAEHHLVGSIETNAYPVKSAEDKTKLDAILPLIEDSTAPVVVVCPRGGGGAQKAYDYLKSQGVAEERLVILEGGIAGWPHDELMTQKR